MNTNFDLPRVSLQLLFGAVAMIVVILSGIVL